MKITGDQVHGVSQVHLHQVKKVQKAASAEASQPTDTVELSSNVGAMEAARQAIAAQPDVRVDKVEALRQQIEAGTYEVDADGIAAKMLAEMRLSKLADK